MPAPGSPRDGRRIAFASGRGVDSIAIYLSSADGTGLVQLTRGPENYHGSPRWSPDGIRIAFDTRGKDGHWNLKVIPSSGGDARPLTSGSFTNTPPSWSGDGNSIYFASDRTGRFEIWRVASDGGDAETQVLERVTGRAFAVFEEGIYYLDSCGPEKYELRLYEFATRRSRVLSAIEGDLGIGFSVSPDRKVFLFSRLASPGSDLMLIENIQ
jgi:Tol biopolymer transport system component